MCRLRPPHWKRPVNRASSGEDNRTTALVDRLLHHAHVVMTDGESLRLADALAGKGVVPLT
ncbi:MAG: ATP-binding protein [Actinomycetota bacterium]|nr:ATP-binding protein [Actinomycetota bacterium]